MALSKESEDALRECLRILARRYPPEQRSVMARNVEQYIQEGKWLPAFLIEHIATLYYPDDEARDAQLRARIADAIARREFVPAASAGRLFASDLAAWPDCPPVPSDSPLRYWLPESMHAQPHASDSQASPESGLRESLVGLSNAPPPARPTPTGAGSAPRMTPQPAPSADWGKWAQLLQVEVWQGVALSLDLEPVEERDRGRWGGMPCDPERYGPEFKNRLAVTVSHVRGGHPKLLDARADEARDVVYLAHFARWAEQNMEWRLPDRMLALAWGTAIRDPARWLRKETWTLHEAAHLLAGKEPVPPDRFDVHPSARGPEQDLYAALKDAVDEAKSIESSEARGSTKYIMLRRVRPLGVTTWAKRSGWHVPGAFAQESQGPTAPTSAPEVAVAADATKGGDDAKARRAHLLVDHEALVSGGARNPTQELAKRKRVTTSRIRNLIRTAKKERTASGKPDGTLPKGSSALHWKLKP